MPQIKSRLVLVVVLGLFTVISPAKILASDWPMVAANPQRTSWVPEASIGDLNLEAYRVIEAYIPQNVQLITANNLIYVATARGLLALYATDPDGSGSLRPLDVKWRFNTQVPLGNSPSIDPATNILYVAGYDRNLYALDAVNGGIPLWTYSGAQAGYSTNPLIFDNKILLGNRDGNFYAINKWVSSANPGGTLAWKYATEGPINFSAAAKNTTVYFASMDSRAYALNTSTGNLVWKSPIMYGDGFYSYWPVIYTEPVSNTDFVIFADSSGYRPYYETRPGVGSMPTCNINNNYSCAYPEWADEWRYNFSGTLSTPVSRSDAWVQGKSVFDFSKLSQYFEENPGGQNPDTNWHKAYRRYYYIYNAQNGSEWSMDTDGDGFKEYMPVDPILSNSGNVYPPFAIDSQTADKRLLYFGNHDEINTTARIVGWRMGTNFMADTGLIRNNGDEPQAFSAGGTYIYRLLTNGRLGGYIDSSSDSGQSLFDYFDTLGNQAPGYDEMWWYPISWDTFEGLYGSFSGIPGPSGHFSSGNTNPNGIYSSHGDQNPLIPSNNKVYFHRSNAVFIYGTGSARGKITPFVPIVNTTQTLTPPTLTQLKSRLEQEIAKFDTDGNGSLNHLRPGYYNAGQQNATYPGLRDYFTQPGDTLLALSMAYPWIDNTTANNNLKDRLKTYLDSEFNTFTQTSWTGAKREWANLPPEVETDMANGAPVETEHDSYYNYALWKYVQNVNPSARTSAISKTTDNGSGKDTPYGAYRNAIGTIGKNYLNNQTPSFTCPTFSKNSPFTQEAGYVQRVLNISRNFMFMVPEYAAHCYQNNATIINALNEYEKIGPYWFVSRYTGSVGESTTQNLYDYPSLFLAKAYIQNVSAAELTKWLDAPAFKVGDLFYIQNLAIAIEKTYAAGPTETPGPTLTPAPTTPPLGTGDYDNDTNFDVVDLMILVRNFGTSAIQKLVSVGSTINIFDFNKLVRTISPPSIPTPVPSTGPIPTPAVGGNWTLTFNDEFEGSSLDRSKWATKYAYDSGHGDRSNNDEAEWYVDNAFSFNENNLTITARRECRTSGSDIYSPYNCTTYPYTSGIISSHNRFSQKYGYFEARVKIPAGAGLWPAFWLLPDPATGSVLPPEPTPWPDPVVFWPPEVDIFENIGSNTQVLKLNNVYSTSYPNPGSQTNNWNAGYDLFDYNGSPTNYASDFYTIALDWQADSLTWYVENNIARQIINTPTNPTSIPPGSLTPGSMYLLLNLAIGGTTGGDPSNTSFPKTMDIDYVRVWERTGTPTPPPATPTPTPASGTQTITFADFTGLVIPEGYAGLNWNNGAWTIDAGTIAGCTQSIWFTSMAATSASFSFTSPRTMSSITACNGGSVSSTVTITCSGNTTVSQSVLAGQHVNIATNFITPCTQVTVTSSNRNDTNIDNIIYH